MNHKYDVIVIGAGPSGCSFSYNLKKLNPDASILLLDKSEFPRYKPCGGGVSPEVANYFDFDLTSQIDYVCNKMVMQANKQEYISDKYPLWMVRREKFDDFLMQKARGIGVEFLNECEALEVINGKNECQVKTGKGNFSSDLVVLAHGSRGIIHKKLSINLENKVFAALEYEHYTNNLDGNLYINLDIIRCGYAWNFPKSDGLSLGAGGSFKGKNKKQSLPKALKDYVSDFKVESVDKEHLHGHPVETYSGRKNLVYNRVLLIGEIAGCVDPLTAEGIRPAIKSGFIAANTVSEFLTTNKLLSLKKYNKAFHNEIGKDLRYANIMGYFLYKHYDRVLPIISSKHAINGFMSVFSGQATYREKIHFKRIISMLIRVIFKKQ